MELKPQHDITMPERKGIYFELAIRKTVFKQHLN